MWAPGPDNIQGRLLMKCAEQIGPIFYMMTLDCGAHILSNDRF